MYSAEYMPWDEEYRTPLVIEDDEGVRGYIDRGEPEDNSFGRDWSWVGVELIKAYEQGLKDGKEGK